MIAVGSKHESRETHQPVHCRSPTTLRVAYRCARGAISTPGARSSSLPSPPPRKRVKASSLSEAWRPRIGRRRDARRRSGLAPRVTRGGIWPRVSMDTSSGVFMNPMLYVPATTGRDYGGGGGGAGDANRSVSVRFSLHSIVHPNT